MKLFTLIFSIYILLLSAVPCCALDRCEDEMGTAQVDHKKTESPAKEKGCSNCSPFFSCHNCCGFIVQERVSFPPVSISYPVKMFGVYMQASYAAYTSSFWQPPRW